MTSYANVCSEETRSKSNGLNSCGQMAVDGQRCGDTFHHEEENEEGEDNQ